MTKRAMSKTTFAAPIKDESGLVRRSVRGDGTMRIEFLSFGSTGRNIYGEPARGHWKLRGYSKDGKFGRTLKKLSIKLAQ